MSTWICFQITIFSVFFIDWTMASRLRHMNHPSCQDSGFFNWWTMNVFPGNKHCTPPKKNKMLEQKFHQKKTPQTWYSMPQCFFDIIWLLVNRKGTVTPESNCVHVFLKYDNHPFHNLSIRLNHSHLNGIFPDLQLRDFGLGVIVLVIIIIQRYGGTWSQC